MTNWTMAGWSRRAQWSVIIVSWAADDFNVWIRVSVDNGRFNSGGNESPCNYISLTSSFEDGKYAISIVPSNSRDTLFRQPIGK